MTLAADLKNLKPGDMLVFRNGYREIPDDLNGVSIGWNLKNGKNRDYVPGWDIVRVIKAKPDKDAAWLRILARCLTATSHEPDRRRLRKIAKRLEKMK